VIGNLPQIALRGRGLPRRHEIVSRPSSNLLIPEKLQSGHPNANSAFRMFDPVSGQLEKYMDLLSARQHLVAANIANADTPGYRARDIDFQNELQSAISGPPREVEVADLPVKNDGNNVSLDRESRMLAENALRFQVASGLLRTKIQNIRSAIKEGA
jgi:flagellar basal-body rod protein FlgB